MRKAGDLTQDYRAAGFGTRLGFGERPALVLIDFVKAYFERESPLYAGVEDTRAAASTLLSAARAARMPIAHTQVRFTPGGADGGLFYRKVGALRHLDGGNPLGDIVTELAPAAGEPVFVKQYASAFFGTSLAAFLTSLRVDTLIIAGLTTSGCVRASAVDAIQHGFRPIVVREAVGDRDPRPHEANLFDIDSKYGDVEALADVLALIGAHRSA